MNIASNIITVEIKDLNGLSPLALEAVSATAKKSGRTPEGFLSDTLTACLQRNISAFTLRMAADPATQAMVEDAMVQASKAAI